MNLRLFAQSQEAFQEMSRGYSERDNGQFFTVVFVLVVIITIFSIAVAIKERKRADHLEKISESLAKNYSELLKSILGKGDGK